MLYKEIEQETEDPIILQDSPQTKLRYRFPQLTSLTLRALRNVIDNQEFGQEMQLQCRQICAPSRSCNHQKPSQLQTQLWFPNRQKPNRVFLTGSRNPANFLLRSAGGRGGPPMTGTVMKNSHRDRTPRPGKTRGGDGSGPPS